MKFYIKPQQIAGRAFTAYCCILLKFYIKPQLAFLRACAFRGCILLKFYIKPQHGRLSRFFCRVVSYWNSTSNHNSCLCISEETALYLIEILHQTTTNTLTNPPKYCCILLKFYIKPQQMHARIRRYRVVSYWNSTSNHNSCLCISEETAVVSYWNSTSNHNPASIGINRGYVVSYWNSTSNHNKRWLRNPGRLVVSYWNSTSNHNPFGITRNVISVVSYWNSTSNHNASRLQGKDAGLYLIEILHQTTTTPRKGYRAEMLYLIEILHQTTTRLPREIPA